MEIRDLNLYFELSWWNEVNTHPQDHMPNTMSYIHNNFEVDEFGMRPTLIKRGLVAGRDELIKITKKFLCQVLILLLVLCNQKSGAPFLQAVLSYLHKHSHRVPNVKFFHDAYTDGSESSSN